MTFDCTTIIHKEGAWFVARCIELGVVSQGKSARAAKRNLKEAVELYLEDLAPRRRRLLRQASRPIVSRMKIVHA